MRHVAAKLVLVAALALTSSALAQTETEESVAREIDAAFASRDAAAAVASISRYLRLNATPGLALKQAELCFFALGDYEQAQRSLDYYFALAKPGDPSLQKAQALKFELAAKKGQVDRHLDRARMHMAAGRNAEAVKEARLALVINPKSAHAAYLVSLLSE